jgi:hypothetical protein
MTVALNFISERKVLSPIYDMNGDEKAANCVLGYLRLPGVPEENHDKSQS